jgi:fibronectin type 3 domain-containing protein
VCFVFCTVVLSAVAVAVPLRPTNVNALAPTPNSVFVSWSGSDGATSYTVWRWENGVYTNLGPPSPPAATSFLDTTATPNTGYFYLIEAHDATGSSGLSDADIATTVIYTDPDLTAGMPIKAIHLTELRTAANLMRALTGAGTIPTYTNPTIVPGSTLATAQHFQEVEAVLLNARSTLHLSVPANLGIVQGAAIPVAHIIALRTYAQ